MLENYLLSHSLKPVAAVVYSSLFHRRAFVYSVKNRRYLGLFHFKSSGGDGLKGISDAPPPPTQLPHTREHYHKTIEKFYRRIWAILLLPYANMNLVTV